MSLYHVVTSSIHQLRNKVSEEHDRLKKKELESGPKASHGYGGRFGVERDRMDKVSWKGDACFKKRQIHSFFGFMIWKLFKSTIFIWALKQNVHILFVLFSPMSTHEIQWKAKPKHWEGLAAVGPATLSLLDWGCRKRKQRREKCVLQSCAACLCIMSVSTSLIFFIVYLVFLCIYHTLYGVYIGVKILMWIYPWEALKYEYFFILSIRCCKSMIKGCLYIESYFPLTLLTSKVDILLKKKGLPSQRGKKKPMKAFSSPLEAFCFVIVDSTVWALHSPMKLLGRKQSFNLKFNNQNWPTHIPKYCKASSQELLGGHASVHSVLTPLCADAADPSMRLETWDEGEVSNFFLAEPLQDIVIWFEVLLNSQIVKHPYLHIRRDLTFKTK